MIKGSRGSGKDSELYSHGYPGIDVRSSRSCELEGLKQYLAWR